MAASAARTVDAGEEALKLLCSEEPPVFLTPSTKLSAASRSAARYLFSSLLPYCSRPPVEELLVEDEYDAEQIWSQIDLLSRPIISSLRRDVKRLQREPLGVPEPEGRPVRKAEPKAREGEDEEENLEAGGGEEDEDVDDGFDDEGDDGEEMNEAEEDDGGERKNVLEDRFLKIKELEEYLEDGEAREYGLPRKGRKLEGNEKKNVIDEDEDNEEEEEDEDDEMSEDLDDDDDNAENARYEDFFGRKNVIHKRTGATKEKTAPDVQEDQISVEEEKDGMEINTQNTGTLSTHEKELLKLRSKIEEMEKANLEPKLWTMQGEVTAVKRPKNSALEVDLDFEHNLRPPPVITEEVTASIEDLIKKRIIEGNFDDVQRESKLPSRAPKDLKELDETKSKKGLAEIYEEEYAQKTGLTSAPLSSSDEHKKEASLLFRKLCLKLDALAHFQFAPKPVIEDMSIQANVPALAMEEIAPVAVSDVAMLAPEEVFQGKGNIKEEAELTQADRKRRRATKKRKFKAEKAKIEARKPRPNAQQLQLNGNEYS